MFGKIASIVNRVKTDEMIRHSLFTVAFIILACFFSFAYDLSMSILLSPERFGILFSLISMHTLIIVVSDFLVLTVAKFTSKLKADGREDSLHHLWRSSLKRALLVSVVVFMVLAALSPLVSRFLNIDEVAYPIILFSLIISAFGLAVNRGVLQGLQRFIPFGLTLALGHFLKFGLGVLLVYLGFEIYGGLAAILIAFTAVFLLSFRFLRDLPPGGSERLSIVGFRSYAGLALLAIFSITMLTNVDVILAKHYFSAADAGNYSALSLLGRVVYYAPMGIGLAMFPKTSALFESAGEYQRPFYKALLMAIITVFCIVAVYGLFPQFITQLLFGDKYPLIVPHIFKYGLAMGMFAISYLLMTYFLSLNQTRVSYALLAVVLIQVTLMFLFHAGIDQLVTIMLACGGLSLACLLPFIDGVCRAGRG